MFQIFSNLKTTDNADDGTSDEDSEVENTYYDDNVDNAVKDTDEYKVIDEPGHNQMVLVSQEKDEDIFSDSVEDEDDSDTGSSSETGCNRIWRRKGYKKGKNKKTVKVRKVYEHVRLTKQEENRKKQVLFRIYKIPTKASAKSNVIRKRKSIKKKLNN